MLVPLEPSIAPELPVVPELPVAPELPSPDADPLVMSSPAVLEPSGPDVGPLVVGINKSSPAVSSPVESSPQPQAIDPMSKPSFVYRMRRTYAHRPSHVSGSPGGSARARRERAHEARSTYRSSVTLTAASLRSEQSTRIQCRPGMRNTVALPPAATLATRATEDGSPP